MVINISYNKAVLKENQENYVLIMAMLIMSFVTASICPSRKGDISALVFRALLTGTCVSLLNASIAGK